MIDTTRRNLLGSAGFTALAGIAAATLAVPEALNDRKVISSVETPPAGLYVEQFAELQRQWATHDGHPDAELIALCDQVVAIERQWHAAGDYDALPGTERCKTAHAEQERLARLKDPLMDRITELPTHTLAGFRARARAIMCSDYGELEREWAFGGQLIFLLEGLAGEAEHG